ncbi:MAG: Lrp/AsnC family transcriptional regulator [Candidatus Micrarchaeia archaeon]
MNSSVLSGLELRLLRFLVANGVRSERELAGALRVKQSTINYCFRRLREKGAVAGVRYRFDLAALGFPVRVKFALRLKGMSDVEKAMSEVMFFPECEHCALLTGAYDVTASFALRSVGDIGSKVMELSERVEGVTAINPVVSLKAFKVHGVRLPLGRERVKCDGVDLKLLAFFASHPGESVVAAARAVGVHRNTAAARWKRLWEEGVVLKESVVVGEDFLAEAGERFRALVFFDVLPGRLGEAVEALSAFPEVHELDWISSRHDLMALVRVSSVEEFQGFHYGVRHHPLLSSVLTDLESLVVLEARSRNSSETLSALAAREFGFGVA